MHTELRILNGLHRGGILPLDETTLLIGAHEDADVVLVDPGIYEHHASLQPTDDGWMLTADAGPVFSTEQASAQMLLDLQVGDFFRLGETWLVISNNATAWQSAPQSMSQSADDDVFNDADDLSDIEPQSIDANAKAFKAALDDATMQAEVTDRPDDAIIGGATEDPTLLSGSVSPRRFKLPRWRRWMIAPATLLMLLGGVAAYAYTAKPSLPKLLHPEMPIAWHTEKSPDGSSAAGNFDSNGRLDEKALSTASSSSSSNLSSTASSTASSSTKAMHTSVASEVTAPSTPHALQGAFRKRLKDADLLQRFDLDLNDTAWSMRAHLDDEEAARFERILKAFVVEHKITFPISAKVGNAESMLPFQIRQIVTGVNAGIVTGDGDRVYVGDELLGVKLVAVVDNHLTFMGKRKIEVIW